MNWIRKIRNIPGLLVMINILFNASPLIAKTPTENYFELRKKYCDQRNTCDITKLPNHPDMARISDISMVVACQNYFHENNCEDVKKRLGKDHQSTMMSCSPDSICHDEVGFNVIQCSIDGVKTQFEIPALAFTFGVSLGVTLSGISSSTMALLTSPLLIYSVGKSAEDCHADIDYKKMLVKIHNLTLFEDEKHLDIAGANKDILKMQCADLKSFLQHRLDSMVNKRLEAARWSVNPDTRRLPAANKALLESLRSNRCLSKSAGHEELCKTIASFAAGTIVGGIAGGVSSKLARLIASKKAIFSVNASSNGLLLSNQDKSLLQTPEAKKMLDSFVREAEKNNPAFLTIPENADYLMKMAATLLKKEVNDPSDLVTKTKNVFQHFSSEFNELQGDPIAQAKLVTFLDNVVLELRKASVKDPASYAKFTTDKAAQKKIFSAALERSGIKKEEIQDLAKCTLTR